MVLPKMKKPLKGLKGKIHRGPKLYPHMSDIVEEKDFKFIPKDPDPNFSVENNRKIIAQTIKENEIREKALKRAYMDGIEERTDAATYFFKALEKGKYSSLPAQEAAVKYFGRKQLARLRGNELLADESLKRSLRKMFNISN